MPKVKPVSVRSRCRFVPYANGFRSPTTKQKEQAIGNSSAEPEFTADAAFFEDIPRCTSSDDWLAQYKEEGQTFENFLHECPWLSRRKVKYMKQEFRAEGRCLPEKYPTGAIYLVPLGTFDPNSSPDFDALVEYAELFFQLPVKKLPALELRFEGEHILLADRETSPQPAGRQKRGASQEPAGQPGQVHYEQLKSRYNSSSGHHQLWVEAALAKLRGMLPDDAICLIGLTMCDLYADRTDLFVAGMAQGRYRVAIFSLYRYDPNLRFSAELWHSLTTTAEYRPAERQRLLVLRSCRLLVHEISHLLGVAHCIYFSCCMNGSGHLAEDFRQPVYLCPVDLHKLQHLCGFNVVARYEQLARFFTRHQLTEEAEWMRRRIEHLVEQQKAPSHSDGLASSSRLPGLATKGALTARVVMNGSADGLLLNGDLPAALTNGASASSTSSSSTSSTASASRWTNGRGQPEGSPLVNGTPSSSTPSSSTASLTADLGKCGSACSSPTYTEGSSSSSSTVSSVEAAGSPSTSNRRT